MSDPAARLEQMTEKLKTRGHRLTPQRLAILKILAASEGHPSAESIHQQIKSDFPTTSLATVYKTISLLKEVKEVLELEFSLGNNRYDGNRVYPHPHLICLKCRTIIDPEISFNDFTREVARKTGYRIVNHRFDLYGICPKCQETT